MTRLQAWLLHLSVLALTATGAAYAWMRYGMESNDPFAVANHPWQPHMLHVHVLAAPIAVFALGLVFSTHIWSKLAGGVKARRWSGLGGLWLLAPMILSGYLMQVVTGETTLLVVKIIHWVSAGLFAALYVGHQVARTTSTLPLSRPRKEERNGELRPMPVPAAEDGDDRTRQSAQTGY